VWDNAKDKYSAVTSDYVRKIFTYDTSDGYLRWKISKQRIIKGNIAGYVNKSDGYRYIGIDHCEFLASRIVWLWMTGEWPRCQIDHIDGIRDNNKWSNLREATNSQNNMNRRSLAKNNTTGVKGVDIRRGKYRVRITVDSREIVVGRFVSLERAKAARRFAEMEYFGEYAPS
jgi:hypothetical protein